MNKRFSAFFLSAVLLIFNSCIGLSMDIQMRKNGSGRINMEYRIPITAETIGRLDGNENWPLIPVGRADWERSIERIKGAELVSFSSRERAQEIITNIRLEFENTEALLNIIDPAKKRASVRDGGLLLIFNEPVLSVINKDLLELLKKVSAGYRFTVSFSAGGNSALSVTDGTGREIPPPEKAEISSAGRKVSLSMETAEILSLANGLGVKINW